MSVTVGASIIQLIKKNIRISASAPIIADTNLYTDLLFDSLSFVRLLTEIEEMYTITFDIAEIESSLRVDRLIEAVENKIRERDMRYD